MAKLSNKSIGLLGGSFDPVHKGHVTISKIALKKIKLDKIYWLITKKKSIQKKTLLPFRKKIGISEKSYQKFE